MLKLLHFYLLRPQIQILRLLETLVHGNYQINEQLQMMMMEVALAIIINKKHYFVLGLLAVKLLAPLIRENSGILPDTINTIMNEIFAFVDLAKEIQ